MEFEKKLKLLRKVKLLRLMFEGICVLKKMNDLVNKPRRSCCVRKANRDRKTNGFFEVTFLKIKKLDDGQFFFHTRMSPAMYDYLLSLMAPKMVKTSKREPINPECRLAVLLMHLSQGTSIQSLAWSFKLGKETIRQIILETADILWRTLYPRYVREPTVEDYERISDDFQTLWNMPNCVGSIDGKHFSMKCPPNCRSQPINYKTFTSIVCIAICNANYCFTNVDVAAYGSPNDGGIFQVSQLGKRLVQNKLPVPMPKNLPGSPVQVPHYFVGDGAFPLCTNLMRPYAGILQTPREENFNIRLSRVHRTIDNSFGILTARWGVLQTTMHMFPDNAEKIILACVALHNFIMLKKENEDYCPSDYIDWEDSDGIFHDGLWRNEVDSNIPSISPSANIHQYGGKSSKTVRNNLCDYFYDY